MPVSAVRHLFIKLLNSYFSEISDTLWLQELMQLSKIPTYISAHLKISTETSSPFENDVSRWHAGI